MGFVGLGTAGSGFPFSAAFRNVHGCLAAQELLAGAGFDDRSGQVFLDFKEAELLQDLDVADVP
ncbi:hypothetical protein SDC9_182224 [bioreactor metagenome]|uniref:Uncharacterized protein n=1 Tax=bioreactor metagenome TaxID=1076179 RepID=A0A645H7S3_9ZZZZ